jgi:predicted Zn-dependent protease
MDDPAPDLAARVLDLLDGRAEGQVRVSRVRHGLTRFANSHIHQNVAEDTLSVDLKVSAAGRIAAAATTRTDEVGLRELVESTLALASLRAPDSDDPGFAPPADVPPGSGAAASTVEATPAERAEVVAGFVGAAADLSAAGYCETQHVTLAYANTAGQQAAAATTRATVDGIHRTPTSSGSGHATTRGLADLDGWAVGARAAALARVGADPSDLAPGHYEVVLSPEAVATIAVFLGLYGFNAKAVAEQRSFVRLDEQQFDPAIDLTDDPLGADAVGWPLDAEGTPKARLDLVRAGTSTALAHDRRSATLAGAQSTGHHVPGSDTIGPIPTDLALAAGPTSRDDLVAGVARGLLVTAFNYCRVLDPKTLVVTGLTRNGTFLIERGAVTRPVANLRFTQSFVTALAPGEVLGVGDDQRYADSEFGPGFVRAPSLRLAAWNFTGGGQG